MTSWNSAGMILEPGLMALWHGRLVEIMEISFGGRTRVKFTDEAGLEWKHTLMNSRALQVLADKETIGVLDALQQAAAPILTIDEQLHRMAELWFAAPEVGDMFERPGDVKVEILYITTGGLITTRVDIYSDLYRNWGWSRVNWRTAAAFRDAYRYHDRPGYVLRAGRTDRPGYFVNHPLLKRP